MNNQLAKSILIETSRGSERWYVIDSCRCYGKVYELLESEKYGDELPCIIIDELHNVVEWNCYDTLQEWLDDNN